MPAFYLIAFIGIVLFFFLLSFIYEPLGKLVKKIFGDAIDIMKNNDSDDKGED